MSTWIDLAVLGYRQARRLVVFVIGVTVVLIGVVMLVAPGPGMLVIPIGLAILAVEFAWARRWLKRIGDTAKDVKDRMVGPKGQC